MECRFYDTLNVRSRGEQLVLCSWESWCSGKHQDSWETKTNWFLERPDSKCFVIFLDSHFNSNKRITGANQNSLLGTYNNTNFILKTTEWMIYKVLSLYYLHLLPPLAAASLLDNFKNHCLLVEASCLCCRVHSQKRKLAVFFPPSVMSLSTMLWSRAVMYPERSTLLNVSRSGYIWI